MAIDGNGGRCQKVVRSENICMREYRRRPINLLSARLSLLPSLVISIDQGNCPIPESLYEITHSTYHYSIKSCK